jgi:hypothetical protein
MWFVCIGACTVAWKSAEANLLPEKLALGNLFETYLKSVYLGIIFLYTGYYSDVQFRWILADLIFYDGHNWMIWCSMVVWCEFLYHWYSRIFLWIDLIQFGVTLSYCLTIALWVMVVWLNIGSIHRIDCALDICEHIVCRSQHWVETGQLQLFCNLLWWLTLARWIILQSGNLSFL